MTRKNSVPVPVLGRDPWWSTRLDADIVVRNLVSGRIDLVVPTSKLESWADKLARAELVAAVAESDALGMLSAITQHLPASTQYNRSAPSSNRPWN
ncbi:DUF5959 family protein [Streptomyces sp. NPDC056390]|uniref:DUF5959 family protein n=1 Tax=Streptomyces sp. NPDC056390 TaxID=3345806 RepID=UPI0035E329CE